MAPTNETLPILDGEIKNIDSLSFTYGGYGDLFRGTWEPVNKEPIIVAIKVFRGSQAENQTEEKVEEHKRRLGRELRVWADLQHRNILPLFGCYTDASIAPAGALVSPYRERGNVCDFLFENPTMERMGILRGIVDGLQHLHSKNLVHGDLKAKNIIVHINGQSLVPQLADFGRSRMLDRKGDTTSLVSSTRYMAPEILQAECATTKAFSKGSDIYSFGMVMLEILTGKKPWDEVLNDTRVIVLVCKGQHPKRQHYHGTFLNDRLWLLMEECWAEEPADRPAVEILLTKLQLAGS